MTPESLCEDTLRRRLSAGQEERPHQNLIMLVPWSHISDSNTVRKLIFFKPPNLWHFVMETQADPYWNKHKPHIHPFSSLCSHQAWYYPLGQNKSHTHFQIMSEKNPQNSREGIHWSQLYSKSNRERKVDLDVWVKGTEFNLFTVDHRKSYWQEKYISSFSLWWVTLINFAVWYFFWEC